MGTYVHDFEAIDQLLADQLRHAGNVEQLRESLKAEVSRALYALDGGLGAAEHAQCMARAEAFIDEHIASVLRLRRGLGEADEEVRDHVKRAVAHLDGREGT